VAGKFSLTCRVGRVDASVLEVHAALPEVAYDYEQYACRLRDPLGLGLHRRLSKRSAMADAAAELWKSLPQSLQGRFVVTMVDARW
jgi:hypothetical protein